MKHFWFFAAVMLLCTVNLAFATQENPTSNSKSDFPESIKVGEKVPFSLKISNLREDRISDIEPIITIMPKSASNFVHVEINPQSTLWDGFYDITHGTIYVDNGIDVDRIFVSVSFMGKNPFGEQVPLSSDSTFNASIKIEKELPNADTSSVFDLEKEKPTCSNSDSKVPLYGCNDTVIVKIDSPLKQFRSGIIAENTVCKEGLHLVIKAENNSPACVIPEHVTKLFERGWIKIIHYYVETSVVPKIELYDFSYGGIDKDNATVSINNQTYYQTTLDYTVNNLKKGTSVQFENVTFAFPEGIMNTPGGQFIMLDIRFQDGSEEIYGRNMVNPDGSGAIGGIKIPATFGPSPARDSITVLGNHGVPQAGLTVHHDKIKLLVSSNRNLSNR